MPPSITIAPSLCWLIRRRAFSMRPRRSSSVIGWTPAVIGRRLRIASGTFGRSCAVELGQTERRLSLGMFFDSYASRIRGGCLFVPFGGLLEGQSQPQGRTFVVNLADESAASTTAVRSAPSVYPQRTTTCGLPVRLVVVRGPEPGTTMTSQSAMNFSNFSDQQGADALRADVFHRRNQARAAERIGPIAGTLAAQRAHLAVAGDVVERRRGFRFQQVPNAGARSS